MVVRLALGQVNPVVGDLDGNAALVVDALRAAEAAGADVVAFGEMVVTGYPPEDLLLKPRFVDDAWATLEKVAAATTTTTAVVGCVEPDGRRLRNAAAVCRGGRVVGTYHKRRLPNYAVFDERRYFAPGEGDVPVFPVGGTVLGVSVCEDAWAPSGPIPELAAAGATVVVNINASPFSAGRQHDREVMLAERARECDRPVAYVNLVGGQDELVFDGGSVVVDRAGGVQARAAHLAPDLLVVDVPLGDGTWSDSPLVAPLTGPAEVYEALVVGTRDYVTKNGFADVVIGLSGGIDSALVASIAVDALGADHVHGVMLPSRYSSRHSLDDSVALAAALGVEVRTIEIEPAHDAMLAMLAPSFASTQPGVAEENVQARLRGTTLMALSNKFGWLLLSTGNKSEMAVGYSTLYGDMNGGFNPIKDVLKTAVYELARWRNQRADGPWIPPAVLTKPPSAELRPDQRDDDTLPPYAVLDPILAAYVEDDRTAAELVDAGHDPALVERIVHLVDANEYKRRQAPPGPRVTGKAFGKDRRLPIVNRYRG